MEKTDTDKQIKTCPKCLLDKPFNEFYACKYRDGKPSSWCKPCSRKAARYRKGEYNPLKQRNFWLKRNYGISVDEFDSMLESQGGKCNICKTSTPNGKGFHVDHCHQTGKIRGILCHNCNINLSSIESAEDKPKYIVAIIDHLGINRSEVSLALED